MQVDFRTVPGVWRRVIGETTFVRPEGNAADPATLYGFFDWAVSECPAERCLLMFWGHSRGQFGMFGDPDPFEYTAQTLTLDELGEALKAAKRSLEKAVDVIAFKDCFMANLETAYELSGLADYLLASPGLVPVEGWPYDEMFGALTVTRRPRGRREQILKALGKHYEERGTHRVQYEEVPVFVVQHQRSERGRRQTRRPGRQRSHGHRASGRRTASSALDGAAATAGDPALVGSGCPGADPAEARSRRKSCLARKVVETATDRIARGCGEGQARRSQKRCEESPQRQAKR